MDESEHIMIVGMGAQAFAVEHGMNLCDAKELKVEREIKKWEAIQGKEAFSTKDAFKSMPADTVGAVAMDTNGAISVGTSTGGTFNKRPGRVGDSPLIGCGSYADNAVGGVSTTGWGEAMIKVVMAKTVVDLMERFDGDVELATKRGIELLKKKVDGYGGIIALNHQGEPGVAFNTSRMARAYVNEQSPEPFIAV